MAASSSLSSAYGAFVALNSYVRAEKRRRERILASPINNVVRLLRRIGIASAPLARAETSCYVLVSMWRKRAKLRGRNVAGGFREWRNHLNGAACGVDVVAVN